MTTKYSILLVICLLISVAPFAVANDFEISGIFGMAPIPEEMALAVWVPLEMGESISGVMWYNNDASISFPEMLAVAGSPQYPSVLNQAVVVGEDVFGSTLDWSELSFPSPLASASSGLFLIFRLPVEGSFVAEGEGSGLGYQRGDGQVKCWVSTEAGQWGQLSPEYQMAVIPVMNTNKSGNVIMLEYAEQAEQGQEETIPESLMSGLNIFPNPFNPQTEISFFLPTSRDVTLAIYDLRGREISTLISDFLTEGVHRIKWDGRNGDGHSQASGVYFCKLKAGSIQFTGRLTLIR